MRKAERRRASIEFDSEGHLYGVRVNGAPLTINEALALAVAAQKASEAAQRAALCAMERGESVIIDDPMLALPLPRPRPSAVVLRFQRGAPSSRASKEASDSPASASA